MGSTNGCFANANLSNHRHSADLKDEGMGDGINFDASRSSAVYTNNGTIRPQSISVLVLLRL